jgi:tetratricopeptide (TPR) repeat protein
MNFKLHLAGDVMLRMLLVGWLGLALAVVARSGDPKPQWQRLLTGADARKAADLEKRIAEREAADNYAEAIRLREELLALRTREQGAEHWQTVDARWVLTATKKVATLPPEKRAGWRQTAQGGVAARRLEQQAQFGKALAMWQERLKWCRDVLGEDHPDTASGYNNVAANLQAQGRYGEARPLYQKALDIRRKALGEDNPLTALGYYNIGHNLAAQGKYAEAGTLYQKALDICRKAEGEDHPDTASSYNNVALNLKAQGKYAEAEPLLHKALATYRKVLGEEHQLTALASNNVALNLQAQGKYAEAGPLLHKALATYRKVLGEEHPDTAGIYNNVAANLEDQGKYAAAEPLFRKSLDINRKVLGEEHPLTANSCNSLAHNLNAQGRYADAGTLYQKALAIYLKVFGEEHPDAAQSYNNVAFNLNAQGKYAAAEPLFRKALDINRKVLGEEHPLTANSCNNLAASLQPQGKYAEAGRLYRKALGIHRKVLGEDHPDTANNYHFVAFNLQAQGRYEEALAPLETAAHSYEAARLNVAPGLERAAYGAKGSPYPFLAAARARAGQGPESWAALEADLARGLLDEMALRRGLGLTPVEQRQRDDLRAGRPALDARVLALVSRPQRTGAETAELEGLIGQRQQLEKELAALAVVVNRREMAPLAQFQAALPADAAFVAWLDVAAPDWGVQEHWGCVAGPQGQPRWERLPGSGPGGQWTDEDTTLPDRFHTALARSAPAADSGALAQKLHAQRLAPLSKHLAGVRRLIVAPVNQMAGIPVEALTDQYTVSYTPSCTYLARLKERERPRGKGLLAVGDPVFPPVKDTPRPSALPPGGLLITQVLPGGAAANARLQPGDVLVSYAGHDLTSVEHLGKLIAARATDKPVVATVWREGQGKLAERELAPGRLGVTLAQEPAREALTARRQADQLLTQLSRGERYAELPGTQVEVARLAELFDAKDVTTLTRDKASEQRLDELRRAGTLGQYRYLHFATHGKANDVRAFESALLLSPPERVPEVRVGEPYLEGRLTAAEVLEYWKLDAELVTLSACESGLGRHGGGDGLLGFAQAFLMAGSRSVCLTLWQVDDTATALLMDRFYRNLLGKRLDAGKPMGKAAALREAKEWLRRLTAAEALERLGALTQGVVRGERPARQEMQAVPKPKDGAKDYRPYAHPRYWAAFILIGDPE